MLVKLAILKSMGYDFQSPYQTLNSNWECILYYGVYITDNEFLSNFRMDRACTHQLNELVKNDEVFSNCWGKLDKQPDDKERKQIGSRIKRAHGFVN